LNVLDVLSSVSSPTSWKAALAIIVAAQSEKLVLSNAPGVIFGCTGKNHPFLEDICIGGY
jgi:hypothetical protein